MTLQLPPLSLYIHIPWCVRKCPYCDFNSHAAGPELPEAAYIEALCQDLDEELHLVQGRKLSSIFIGGGTPSLFSAAAIGRILDHARQQIGFTDSIEITLEANPGTFEQDKFTGYREMGVNRLSIGIQSFQGEHLQRLGRIHNEQEALRAVGVARRAGFSNLNLDLMHGLPGQSLAQALADLQQAIDLGVEHISWYQLTIEPNTEFYSRPPQLPLDDDLAGIQDHGHQLLASNGYQQYEVSAYSRSGRQSAHNRNYWQFGDYLGIGAGAHGKLTLTAASPDALIRRRKTRLPQHYLDPQRAFCAESSPIAEADRTLEFMMNALRLQQGVAASLFAARTGIPLTTIAPTLQRLRQQGLLEDVADRIAPTATGSRFLNSVLEAFL